MTDGELESARRLANLLDTSVSAAVAKSVTIALQAELLQQYASHCVDLLTKAAKATAAGHDGDDVTHRVVLQLPNTPDAYQAASIGNAYDEAIQRHAESLARQAAAIGTLEQPTPFDLPGRPDVYFTWDLQRLRQQYASPTLLDLSPGSKTTVDLVELFLYGQPWTLQTERHTDGKS